MVIIPYLYRSEETKRGKNTREYKYLDIFISAYYVKISFCLGVGNVY